MGRVGAFIGEGRVAHGERPFSETTGDYDELKRLRAENAELRKRLEPIEECYKDASTGTLADFYLRCEKAIDTCMVLKIK